MTKADLRKLMEWSEEQRRLRENDALANYCFKNLTLRIESVMDYVPERAPEMFETRLGKPKLAVVHNVSSLATWGSEPANGGSDE